MELTFKETYDLWELLPEDSALRSHLEPAIERYFNQIREIVAEHDSDEKIRDEVMKLRPEPADVILEVKR